MVEAVLVVGARASRKLTIFGAEPGSHLLRIRLYPMSACFAPHYELPIGRHGYGERYRGYCECFKPGRRPDQHL